MRDTILATRVDIHANTLDKKPVRLTSQSGCIHFPTPEGFRKELVERQIQDLDIAFGNKHQLGLPVAPASPSVSASLGGIKERTGGSNSVYLAFWTASQELDLLGAGSWGPLTQTLQGPGTDEWPANVEVDL